ncbi:MAG TPA: hypothetical protein VIL99_04765 [Ignavibacteria bacterium]
MRKILFLFVFSIVLNSCATIINHPFQKIHINHDPDISIRVDTAKYLYRSSEIYNVFIPKNYVEKDFYFLRSKNEIPLIINETDTFKLKPHRSYFAYWFANIYTSYGLGMLIDYTNDKSFEYPIYNYFTRVNSQIKNVRFKPIPEKKVKFTIGVPSINFFHIQTDSGKINSASGLGISAGVEYFLKENIYLSINIGVTMNLYSKRNDTINEMHAFKDFYFGSNKASSAKYLNFRVNKISPRCEYGIGLTLTNLNWHSNNRTDLTDSTYFYSPTSYKSLNLGLTSDLRLRLTPNFNIGIQYQPLFFDFQHKEYNYQHFITTELIWRF